MLERARDVWKELQIKPDKQGEDALALRCFPGLHWAALGFTGLC